MSSTTIEQVGSIAYSHLATPGAIIVGRYTDEGTELESSKIQGTPDEHKKIYQENLRAMKGGTPIPKIEIPIKVEKPAKKKAARKNKGTKPVDDIYTRHLITQDASHKEKVNPSETSIPTSAYHEVIKAAASDIPEEPKTQTKPITNLTNVAFITPHGKIKVKVEHILEEAISFMLVLHEDSIAFEPKPGDSFEINYNRRTVKVIYHGFLHRWIDGEKMLMLLMKEEQD